MTRKAARRKVAPVRARKAGMAAPAPSAAEPYRGLLGGIETLLGEARRTSARAVNALMTATYWEIGRRVVEYEQGGKARAEYGETLLKQLAADLTSRFGRGFGVDNLQRFRVFYLTYPPQLIYATASRISGVRPVAGDLPRILSTPSRNSSASNYATASRKSLAGKERPTPSGKSDAAIFQTLSEESTLGQLASRFLLPWSAYVRLLSVKNEHARSFYETEALRGGWSVRQLDRQIQSQFYERTALSRNKAAMLTKGAPPQAGDAVAPEEEVKDPYVLEFLGLRDEYSETDLEDALIRHLETFLLELGGDFCFAGRQKRLRIGDEWFRVDLVFYHRRLRCLVLIDLKLGRFTHADAGQMHTYLNYAAEHWTRADENPPVGLILCAQRDDALARYALDNLPNKVMAAEYRTVLPDEKMIAHEVAETRRTLEERARLGRGPREKKRGGLEEGA